MQNLKTFHPKQEDIDKLFPHYEFFAIIIMYFGGRDE